MISAGVSGFLCFVRRQLQELARKLQYVAPGRALSAHPSALAWTLRVRMRCSLEHHPWAPGSGIENPATAVGAACGEHCGMLWQGRAQAALARS